MSTQLAVEGAKTAVGIFVAMFSAAAGVVSGRWLTRKVIHRLAGEDPEAESNPRFPVGVELALSGIHSSLSSLSSRVTELAFKKDLEEKVVEKVIKKELEEREEGNGKEEEHGKTHATGRKHAHA